VLNPTPDFIPPLEPTPFPTPTPSAMSAAPDTSHELHLRTEPLSVGQHLILGCSPLAGIYDSIPESQAYDTVKAALELGFLDLDTAPHYGLGLSEARTGRAVAMHAGGRSVRLWTKVGRVLKPHAEVAAEDEVERGNMPGSAGCIFPDSPTDVSPVLDYTGDGVRRSHADSLRRLGAGAVQGLRVHDAEDEERFAQAMAPGGGIDALVELRSKGAIKSVSLGMNDAAYVLRMLQGKPPGTFDSIMSAGSWNLIDQDGYDLMLECQRRGVKVHNAGIFASGLLVGGSYYKYAPATPEVLERRERWTQLAVKHGVSLPVVAVAFALMPAVVEKAAVGVKSAEEVRMNVEWLRAAPSVPAALWAEAKHLGLLAERVPVPS